MTDKDRIKMATAALLNAQLLLPDYPLQAGPKIEAALRLLRECEIKERKQAA